LINLAASVWETATGILIGWSSILVHSEVFAVLQPLAGVEKLQCSTTKQAQVFGPFTGVVDFGVFCIYALYSFWHLLLIKMQGSSVLGSANVGGGNCILSSYYVPWNSSTLQQNGD
jgi:hypothetical protein